MNTQTQTQIKQLKALLQQLLEWAQQLDRKKKPGKPQHWFDSALFSCHSPDLADYVLDSLRHLEHLQRQGDTLSEAARQRLIERLNEQVAALTLAFRNREVRQQQPSMPRTKAVVQQLAASSQQLYQQLSEYQQFENRLLDMVRLAERDDSSEATNKTLALHARLGRCRKAINEVEQAIQQLESGYRK